MCQWYGRIMEKYIARTMRAGGLICQKSSIRTMRLVPYRYGIRVLLHELKCKRSSTKVAVMILNAATMLKRKVQARCIFSYMKEFYTSTNKLICSNCCCKFLRVSRFCSAEQLF